MTNVVVATSGDENWVLSEDGSVLYVAGNDGMLSVFDAQTGNLLHSVQLGYDLGAISLSPDGTRLAIVEEVAENVEQSNDWPSNTADVSFYVIDVATFAGQEFTYTVTGSDFTFADVAWSDNDTVQLSQNILEGWSGWAALSTVELETGARSLSSSYYAGLGTAASLTTIEGTDTVLLGQLGLSSAEYFLIAPDGSRSETNGTYENGVYGGAYGIEAASGTTANDRIVIVTGGDVHLYDGTMEYVERLSEFYPTLGSASGVTFSDDGSRIFFLDPQSQAIVVIDAYNYSLVATIDVPEANFQTLQWGEEIIVASDGNGVFYNTAEGIAYAAVTLPDIGTSGNDVMYGTENDNLLEGRAGDDAIYGLAGNDWLLGGDGNDLLDGGLGFDLAAYDDATGAVTVNLFAGGAQGTGAAGTDTLVSIEGLIGSQYDDMLIGDNNSNLLVGLGGADFLRGNGGYDDLYGEDGNDILLGDAGIDWLFGGEGEDLLNGGYGADRLEGGNGNDTYMIDNIDDVIVETATGGYDVMRVSGINAIIASGVEELVIMNGSFNATGNFVNNILVGSDDANTLSGLGGNDTLHGKAGDDILDGGAGNDLLDGGTGLDTATYAGAGNAVSVSLALSGTAQNTGGAGTDTLIEVENLIGSAWNDQIVGDDAGNVLIGLAGNDSIDGGGGDDTLDGGIGNDVLSGSSGIDTASYADAGSAVRIYLSLSGAAQNTIGAGSDTLISIENVTGSEFADTLAGDGGRNALWGLAGNDTLEGAGGDDTLDGGSGRDTLYGGTGWDTLDGGGGNDLLNGGNGNDRASYFSAWSGVTVSLALEGAQNTLGSGWDTLVSIEYLTGSAHADVLTGSAGNNQIFGAGGADHVLGGFGDDLLLGQGGDDVIEGQAGWDFLRGDDGNDTLIGGNGGDMLLGGGGIDMLSGNSGFDRIYGGSGGDILSGGADRDLLFGEAGDDTISGDGGNDLLLGNNGDDTLDGGDGNDVVNGGAGNDTLLGGDGDDILLGNWGVDTMTGGAGGDSFLFKAGHTGSFENLADTILDFSRAEGDRIDLSQIDAIAGGGDDAFAFIGDAAFSGTAGELRVTATDAGLMVEGDTDGDGVADLFIAVDGLTDLTMGDFVL